MIQFSAELRGHETPHTARDKCGAVYPEEIQERKSSGSQCSGASFIYPLGPTLQPWVLFREVGRVLGCCVISALKAEVLLCGNVCLWLSCPKEEGGSNHACDPGQLQV